MTSGGSSPGALTFPPLFLFWLGREERPDRHAVFPPKEPESALARAGRKSGQGAGGQDAGGEGGTFVERDGGNERRARKGWLSHVVGCEREIGRRVPPGISPPLLSLSLSLSLSCSSLLLLLLILLVSLFHALSPLRSSSSFSVAAKKKKREREKESSAAATADDDGDDAASFFPLSTFLDLDLDLDLDPDDLFSRSNNNKTDDFRGRRGCQGPQVASGHPRSHHLLPDRRGVRAPGRVHRENHGKGFAAGCVFFPLSLLKRERKGEKKPSFSSLFLSLFPPLPSPLLYYQFSIPLGICKIVPPVNMMAVPAQEVSFFPSSRFLFCFCSLFGETLSLFDLIGWNLQEGLCERENDQSRMSGVMSASLSSVCCCPCAICDV